MVSMPRLSGILIYMSICMDAWVYSYIHDYIATRINCIAMHVAI